MSSHDLWTGAFYRPTAAMHNRQGQKAHVHAGLLEDEGLANGVSDLGSAVDEAVGKLRHAVCWNLPAARICMQHLQQCRHVLYLSKGTAVRTTHLGIRWNRWGLVTWGALCRQHRSDHAAQHHC